MTRDLTADDRGKPLVGPEGTPIGTITHVQDGRGHVETDDNSAGLTDKLKSALGWDGSDDEDTHELRNDHVDSVNDDEVRLRNL